MTSAGVDSLLPKARDVGRIEIRAGRSNLGRDRRDGRAKFTRVVGERGIAEDDKQSCQRDEQGRACERRGARMPTDQLHGMATTTKRGAVGVYDVDVCSVSCSRSVGSRRLVSFHAVSGWMRSIS